MAFLHGVLESVKDDESVKTYDKDVQAPKIGTGPEDFEKTLADVSWWIAKYHGELQTKTAGVTDALGDYYKEVAGQGRQKLQVQLDKWKGTTEKIENELDNIEKQQINVLDRCLKHKIKREMHDVRGALWLLKQSAEEKAYKAKVKQVDEELLKQEKTVRDTLDNGFGNIDQKLATLQAVKKEKFRHISVAIALIKSQMDMFNWEYSDKLQEYFNEINKELLDLDPKNTNTGGDGSENSKFWKDVDNIRSKLGDINNKLGHYVGELENWTRNTNEDIEFAEKQVMKIIKTAVGMDRQETIKQKAEEMEEWTEKLQNHIEDLKNEIKQKVTETRQKIKELDSKCKDDLKGLRDEIKIVIGQYMGKLYLAAKEGKTGDLGALVSKLGTTSRLRGWLEAVQNGKVSGITMNADKTVIPYVLQALTNSANADNGLASGMTAYTAIVQDLQTSIGTRFLGADKKTDYVGNVMKHYNKYIHGDIDDALTAIAGKTTVINADGTKQELQRWSEAIKENIEKLTKAFSDKGKDVILNFHHLKTHQIDDQLNKILIKIDKLQRETLSGVYGDDMSSILGKIKQLETVLTTVEDQRRKAVKLMDSLRNELNAKLSDIEKAVANASEALDNAISGLHSALQNAYKNSQQAVTNAFEALTTEVQCLFAEQKLADLSALKVLVERQLRQIKDIILEDKNTGAKGFLSKMKDDFIDPLIKFLNTSPLQKNKLAHLAKKVNEYFATFFTDLQKQTDFRFDYQNVETFKATLTKLLKQLGDSQHFDHHFSDNLNALQTTLAQTVPHKFGEASTTLLQSLKEGIDALADQLEKAYVNKYSGEDWKKNHADKYAKIMLTSTSTLYEELYHLFYSCHKDWSKLKIDGSEKATKHIGDFKKYLESQGYQAASLINKNHTGQEVAEKLKTAFSNYDDFDTPSDLRYSDVGTYLNSIRREWGPMSLLYRHLATYYSVCHTRIPTAPKSPCTIRDMLGWMCGLPYTAVYHSIKTHCNTMLNEKINGTDKYPNKEDPVLRPILETGIVKYIAHTCQYSYETLTTICGNGHGAPTADYPYASNFCDNSRNFYYPQRASELFDMLNAICPRLLRALYSLYSQCRYTVADGNGWRDCQYGGKVSGYQWDCKKSVDKPMCQANTEPKCQAKCQPNDQTTCYPKSPLQAHLMDGLPGHLPHKLSSVGCTSKCSTCPKQSPGMVCLTPMGFWDLTHAGSKNGTGKDICNVLSEFCGNADSPLPTLLNYLMQVSPMPPKSLADQFSFFTNIFRQWSSGRFSTSDRLVNHMNTKIIPAMSMKLYADEATNFTNQLKSLSGPTSDHPVTKTDKSTHCDLYSLCTQITLHPADRCSVPNGQCAPYLKPLCADAHHTYATKHANLYLSWLTYLPFDFYNLLKSLFEAFCNIDCKAGGCSACNCAVGKHGLQFQCTCKSYVQCHGVRMILNNYGFTFGDSKTLMANPDKRFCHNFYGKLKAVIESEHFKTLLQKCDDVLYYIRSPFMNTLLALWSLSLLYLLHIAVVRLDVLRIRSHLRSPASHRIAAQSLLAAARVRALANVKQSALDDIDARRISLGQLAGQLSGFIGGGNEVKNALVKGLQSNVNELIKRLQTSCGDEGCCKYVEKNQLNEVNDKLKKHLKDDQNPSVNLADILTKCKLNPSDGPLNKLNDEIPKKIQGLENEIESLNNADKERIKRNETPQNASEIAKLNKDLQSHQASMKSLETLNQLCGYADSLSKIQQDENPSTTLLNNLCGGLEKFLGYQNGNYTGSGIVYSDLDRLCDGVMAFLHSVLKDVHDKQPYSVGKETQLKGVVKLLKDKLCSGHNGFKSVIGQVAQGVREYNREVERSNESVKEKIEEMQKNMKTLQSQVSGILKDHSDAGTLNNFTPEEVEKVEAAVTTAENLANEYAKKSDNFNGSFDDRIPQRRGFKAERKQEFKDLNSTLRDKIDSAIENISHETDRLKTLTKRQKDNLDAMTGKIAGAFRSLIRCVNDEIRIKVNKLVEDLNKKVSEILKLLKSISATLWNYVGKLAEWMKEAEKVVDKAITNVKGVADKGLAWPKDDELKQKAKDLGLKAEYVYKQFENANNQVGTSVESAKKDKVNELTKWKDAADAVIVKAQGKCGDILEKVKTEKSKDGEIHKEAEKLKEKATDLLTAYQSTHEKVTGLGQKVTEAIEDLEKGMKDDLQRLQKDIVSKMKEHVGSMLGDIKGRVESIKGEGSKNTGLEGIVQGLAQYVTEFGTSKKLETAIKDMVGRIVKSSGIRAYLDYYAKNTKKELHDVKQKIITELPKLIQQAISESAQKAGINGELDLTRIESQFANLAQNIQNKELTMTPTLMEGDLEGKLGLKPSTPQTHNYRSHLQHPVNIISMAVFSAISNAAKELQTLIETSNIKNLKEASENANKLHSSLTTAHEQTGDGANPGAHNGDSLAKKVDEIQQQVKTAMKDTSGEINVEDVMSTYKQKKGNDGGGEHKYHNLLHKDIPKAMSAFKKMKAFNSEDPLDSGTVSKATTAVTKHFTTIEQELQAIAHYVDKDKPAPKLQLPDEDGLTQLLTTLKTTALSQNDNTWGDGDKTSTKGLLKIKAEIEGALEGIKTRAADDFRFASEAAETGKIFSKLSEQITKNLTGILDAFAEKGKTVKETLEGLKNSKISRTYLGGAKAVEGTLQKIYDDLVTLLREKLEPVVNLATVFEKEAKQLRDSTISALDRHVEQQANTAQDQLITLANKNYVTSVKEMLNAFASRVEKILQPLPKDIDTDRREGFKGFMRTFEGTINENNTTQDHINLLKGLADLSVESAKEKAKLFKTLSAEFQKWYNHINTYILGETKREHTENVKKRNPPVQVTEKDPHPCVEHLSTMKSKLDNLLNHLSDHDNASRKYIFDTTFQEHLSALHALLSTIRPASYSAPTNPLLDILKYGLQDFLKQLSYAYVNVYDGVTFKQLTEQKKIIGADTQAKTSETQLSTEGRNCAKICLTVFDILSDKWDEMKSSCGSHGDKQIHVGMVNKPGGITAKGQTEKIKNPLGIYFEQLGYKVSADEGKQDGELKTHSDKNGSAINTLCEKEIDISNTGLLDVLKRLDLGITHKSIKLNKLVNYLYHILDKYRHACHLRHIPGAKPPTNICQMLYWLSAIQWNPMYNELRLHFDTWFKASTNDYKLSSDSFDVAAPYRDAWTMKATVSIKNIKDLFNTVTLRSYEILRAFVGHGHADGRYACEFYTNPDNLEYPNDISKCFDMLVDICLRLNYQLHFLYTQCCNGPDSSGWRDCHYGRHVGGSNWSCNKLQCPGQQGDQSANQIANQTCEQHPKCCIKSPLQAYLEDGLPGFLPHTFTLPSCKLTCSVRDHRGIPCITPMGFTDIGIAASHTKTGAHLKSLLQPFCSSAREPLTMLCAFFTCLIRRPPQNLGDMFAFYYNFLEHWGGHYDGDKKTAKEHKQEAFQNAVTAANFGRPYYAL
ncbi:hypothetical protein, conserved [Babesia ovata]|uniref:C3H1-type domain-containing protein n=1 Tax=Babesia ovata TaxID=189622 RepID=A0A2H6KK19_9APIC|nr:uncharacterized protein BOVATA_048360 [Babesia ovata]GBE63343.1 hypothetical protein, conserved [Babesia ovata]